MLTRSTALGSLEDGPNADSSEAYARDEFALVVFWDRIVRMLKCEMTSRAESQPQKPDPRAERHEDIQSIGDGRYSAA